MNSIYTRALCGGALLLSITGVSLAQTQTALVTPATPKPTVTQLAPELLAPPEMRGPNAADGTKVPNETTVIPPVKAKRPLNIGIYQGIGAPDGSVDAIKQRALTLEGAKVTLIKAEEFATMDLSQFDIIAFSGGMSTAQAKGLGKAGRDAVVRYVYNGGSYLGICAGAYLATSGNEWSLGILNGRTVSPDWLRGAAYLKLQLSPDGQSIFDGPKDTFYVRYHNGPIIEPANKPELPPYTVDAYFRTEVDGFKTTPIGIQVNSPAVIRATYGKGRVLTISPHPENSRGLENFIPRGLVWLGDKSDK